MVKRILVITNTIDAGGAETFVMKVFRCLDRGKLCFDFLINKKDSSFYRKEIEELGGKIYFGTPKSRNPLKCFMSVYKTVKAGGYDCIFCIAVHPLGFLDLLAAKMAGANIRLTRSTNSNSGGAMTTLAAYICRPVISCLSTTMLAPSTEAAIWLFGKHSVTKGRVCIVKNGLNIEQYAFGSGIREKIRCSLDISDHTLVVGHVGRFNRQKNHRFVLEVFARIKADRPDSVLLLIGDGELREEAESQADVLGIRNSVKFLGICGNVNEMLMAMDVLLFPSFYEGMPNVVIEAQATGLPCLISDIITKEVKLTDLVYFKPLNEGKESWARSIVNLGTINTNREKYSEIIRDAGYSIECTAEMLIRIFEMEI